MFIGISKLVIVAIFYFLIYIFSTNKETKNEGINQNIIFHFGTREPVN